MSLEALRRRFPDAAGRRSFLVTEVTKMQRGEVCVAAIDLQSLLVVRPLQWNHRNWPIELTERGLQPRRIVSQRIRPEQNHKGYPHQTEDTQLSDTFAFGEAIDDGEFYASLAPAVDPSIDDLFAGNLLDGKYVVEGTRCRSLGSVLIQSETLNLYAGYNGKLRAAFRDANTAYDLPVTDLSVLRADEQAGSRAYRAESQAPPVWERRLSSVSAWRAHGMAGTENMSRSGAISNSMASSSRCEG